MSETTEYEATDMLDKDLIDKEIKDGSTALKRLKDNAGKSMEDWAVAIHGWRALRDLIFAETQTIDVNADAYRKSMTEKFRLRKYLQYSELERWQRSAMYKLADCIDDVMEWYRDQERSKQLRWQTPEALLKNVPSKLLHGVAHGANRPKRMRQKQKRPRAAPPELGAMHALMIALIEEFVMPVNPKRATELMTQAGKLMAQFHSDPSDSLDDFAAAEEDEEEEAA